MRIQEFDFNFQRKKFIRPFKFKGGAFSEKWINVIAIRSGSGNEAIGIGSTAVLWSDPLVFSSHSESGANLLMSSVTERACKLLTKIEFNDPLDAVEKIFPGLHEYAIKITANENLRPTFTLNSLIAPDNALWNLFFKESPCKNFGELIELKHPGTFSFKHDKLAWIPLVTYDVEIDEIKNFIDNGVFILKIKIGQSGSQCEMLQKDKKRLSDIFNAIGHRETSQTDIGKIVFYLDANGRYESRKLLVELLEHCEKIGMLEQVLILEEPFPEELEIDVSDLPVKIAADESLHSVEDAVRRIDLGYEALCLKPIGKTMSLSLAIGETAIKRGVPCYVADSACVPLLVEWNKCLAAHLPLFPGLKCGFLESNGARFYSDWKKLLDESTSQGSAWIKPQKGMYMLGSSFYKKSGGIFDYPETYSRLVKFKN